MKALVVNLFLAVTWMAATANLSTLNFFTGLVLGGIQMWLCRDLLGEMAHFVKWKRALSFLCFYLWQLILASLRVAFDIITPRHHMKAAIIAIPLDAKTPLEITLFGNLISLTPGTLTIDISPDNRILYVHVMYFEDSVEDFVAKLKSEYEKPVLELLR